MQDGRNISAPIRDRRPWTKAEWFKALGVLCTLPMEYAKKHIGRSRSAIHRVAKKEGVKISSLLWSVNRLMKETGYNQKQINRAIDRIPIRVIRKDKSRRAGLTSNQVEKILEYLKTEVYVPPSPEKRSQWVRKGWETRRKNREKAKESE